MLTDGIIKLSSSAWSGPIVMIPITLWTKPGSLIDDVVTREENRIALTSFQHVKTK